MALNPTLGVGYMEAVKSLAEQIEAGEGLTPAAFQADSVAEDVPTLVADFNTLLASLQAAGLMASS